jgi:hypothetical protein
VRNAKTGASNVTDDLLNRLQTQFEQLTEAVRGYASLSEDEISRRVERPWLIRDQDLYPEPFPRDGTKLLPDEFSLRSSIADGLDRLVPGRASLGFRLAKVSKALELALIHREQARGIFDFVVKILEELDEEWETIVPIESLDLRVGVLEVGPVRFYPIEEGDDFTKWRLRETTERLQKDTPFLAEWAQKSTKHPVSFDTLSSNVKSYAKVAAKGDSLLASESALELVGQAIDVLRLFLATSETAHWGGGANFRLAGYGGIFKLEYGQRMICDKGTPIEPLPEPFSVTETLYVGFAAPYRVLIDEEILQWMTGLGFGLFGQVVDKPKNDRSDLERRIMRAVAWFSQAVSARERTDRFLKLVIALDSLLGGGPGEDGGTQVAERLAFLLDPDVERRKAIKKRAKGYFKLRGPLAHGSRAEEPPFAPLYSVEMDCQRAIQRFALDHLHRKVFNSFLEWIEEQKFSTPADG